MKAYRYEANPDLMTKEESVAWAKIEQGFRAAKALNPHKGFARRWLQMQQRRQLAERKQRELWLALGNGTAILVILGVIAITIWPLFGKPATLVAGALEAVFDGLMFIAVYIGMGLSIFQTFTPWVWLVVATGFFSLLALWVSLFSRLAVENG